MGMHSSHSPLAGFIFGVPKTGDRRYVLDVVATNRITYETGLLKLAINVTKKEEEERVRRRAQPVFTQANSVTCNSLGLVRGEAEDRQPEPGGHVRRAPTQEPRRPLHPQVLEGVGGGPATSKEGGKGRASSQRTQLTR